MLLLLLFWCIFFNVWWVRITITKHWLYATIRTAYSTQHRYGSLFNLQNNNDNNNVGKNCQSIMLNATQRTHTKWLRFVHIVNGCVLCAVWWLWLKIALLNVINIRGVWRCCLASDFNESGRINIGSRHNVMRV